MAGDLVNVHGSRNSLHKPVKMIETISLLFELDCKWTVDAQGITRFGLAFGL